MKSKLIIILLIFFILLFLVSGYVVVSTLITDEIEQDAFNGLAEIVAQEKYEETAFYETTQPTETSQTFPNNTDIVESTEITDEDFSAVLPEYKKIFQLNNDLFGWIRIENTVISYPVMYTPNDPEYYLRRAFDKSDSESGTPFVDASCYDKGGIYLVYGHNMKNGSMFAELTKYAEKKYRDEHPIIHFDTIYERGQFEVIAAFYSKVFTGDEQGFCYYQYTDLAAPAVFIEYIEQVKAAALYDTGATAEYGDQLLTLSTCDYYAENGRFVVVAKRVS